MGNYIRVDGMADLNRTLRRAPKGVQKAVGRANKQVGRQFIDRWLNPSPNVAAVGAGAGAKVRPSAAKRELKLRVGGGHRAGKTPYMQWGKRPGRPVGDRAPARPYILQSAYRRRDDIAAAWLDEIARELSDFDWTTT